MSEIVCELATLADDPELRRMLCKNPVPGAVSVSFERKLNYFIATRVEGPFHQTIAVRERSNGRIVGMGTRSIRDLYLNGLPQPVGYLSQLRIDPPYRQTIVRGYAGPLGRWHALVNVSARLAGWPVLPPLNTPFHYCYASHLAIDDDRPGVFATLVRALHNQDDDKKYHYSMLGLSERHPLLHLATTYRHIDYRSVLYLVAWETELESSSQLDNRAHAAEIAIL